MLHHAKAFFSNGRSDDLAATEDVKHALGCRVIRLDSGCQRSMYNPRDQGRVDPGY